MPAAPAVEVKEKAPGRSAYTRSPLSKPKMRAPERRLAYDRRDQFSSEWW